MNLTPVARSSFLFMMAAAALVAGAALPGGVAGEAGDQRPTIRIKAGVTRPRTDETGVVWQPDQGFSGGETIERPTLAIANTRTPSVYQAERYSMLGFSQSLPNGKYLVKLHFAETFEGIGGAGERVFSFSVQGKEFKDFDVFAKSGGFARAYIETVSVEITNGKLEIAFTPKIENPEINAIEIIPVP